MTNVDINKKIEDATVFIGVYLCDSNSKEGIKRTSGTGFLVSNDGYVITCAHVLEGWIMGDPEVLVRNNEWITAKIIRIDSDYDIAIIKLDKTENLPEPLILGNSDEVKDGQEVGIRGYPLTSFFRRAGLDLRSSLTTGIISTTKKAASKITKKRIQIIEHTAISNPGNSGGPLFDRKTGIVYGVVSAGLVGAGLNFAIPINVVKWFIGEGVLLQAPSPDVLLKEVDFDVLINDTKINSEPIKIKIKETDKEVPLKVILLNTGTESTKDVYFHLFIPETLKIQVPRGWITMDDRLPEQHIYTLVTNMIHSGMQMQLGKIAIVSFNTASYGLMYSINAEKIGRISKQFNIEIIREVQKLAEESKK